MRKSKKLLSVSGTIVAVALALSACGGSSAAKGNATSRASVAHGHFPVLSAGWLEASKAIPAPGDTVLDVTGRISRANGKGRLSLDLATLERMPLVGGPVYEPFVKERTNFSGVLLSDLLTAAGADAKATEVFITALDDYTWSLPLHVARSGEVLLATRENGKAIPVEKGGPIRIVFSDDSVAGKNTNAWVWSVRGMEVR